MNPTAATWYGFRAVQCWPSMRTTACRLSPRNEHCRFDGFSNLTELRPFLQGHEADISTHVIHVTRHACLAAQGALWHEVHAG